LQRDEYLYLDQGYHLAWGYLSVPPLTSWLSALIILFGKSVFWVKFFPALFGALTILIVWKTIESLGGSLYALILGAVCVLFSSLLRLNTLFQPNSFDVLAWTALYFFIIQFVKTEQYKWLYYAAIGFALGFLNKYNIAFLAIGLFPALLISRHRTIFLKKQLYLAALLAFILILPNLIWQANNDFPVVRHMQELAERQLVNVNRADFLKGQLLFFLGSVPVIFLGLLAFWIHKPFQKYRFFFWTLLFTLAVFVYFKAKDYYAIGLYPIYIAFGAVFTERLFSQNWKVYLRAIPLLFACLVLFPMLRIAFPNKSPEYIIAHQDKYKELGMLRWEDGKDHDLPQDYADMLGWQELARKVDSVYAEIPDATATLVLCDNYGLAGAINFYTKRGIHAVSFNADYINWFDLSIPYKNLIRVKEAHELDTEMQKTSPYFETSEIAGTINNRFSREYGTVIFCFTGTKVDINARIEQEIKAVKNPVEQ